MKKLIVVFLCVVVIAGIGVGVFWQMQKERLSIESVLPQDALIYVQLRDVEQNFKTIASMPFWQGIRDIDYDLLIEKNALDAGAGKFINLVRVQLFEVLTNPLSKRLFGREVAYAIYPPGKDVDTLLQEIKVPDPKIIEELLSGLFLVTRIDPDIQFAEFTSRFFNQYGANITQEQTEYKGEVIHTVTATDIGMTFGIVRLKDLLVIGIGEKPARMSVDVFKQDALALAQDPQFVRIQKTFLDPSGMAGVLDFEALITLFKTQAEKFIGGSGKDLVNEEAQSQWNKVFAQMDGFKTIGFSSRLAPVIRYDSHLVFDPKGLNPEYAPLYACSPEENKTIRFIPKEVLGYQWSNCFQLDYYWKQFKKELVRTETPVSKIDELETQIGMSIEKDILPTFGDEIGGYIEDIQVGGLFPIPKLLFFIEIKNKFRAEQLLARLKDQPIVMLKEETYNGIPVKYLALPLGEIVQPGYCFLGDYLLIATSRQLLKDSIDASQNADMSLSASPAFKEIDFGLTDKNRNVQFVKVGRIIEKLKGVIGWSNQWMASQDRKADAFKSGSEKPLEEVKANIAVKEGELKDIRNRVILLEDEIWNKETKGIGVSAQQVELNELRNQLDAKKAEITDENERKEGLANIVQEYDESVPDPALRQLYLDEVIYPVLESLKSIRSYGLRATVDEDVIKSSIFLKIEE